MAVSNISHKGHENNTEVNHKSPQTKQNESLFSISKKTEKLITALYMVTDFMNNEEPLKKKLRTLGVELLSEVQSIGHSTAVYFDPAKIVQKVKEII